ncbi:MAG: arsenate reductase family protein [Gammaproteobacteria bacterium]|nr:arsenate reductase family protein [Gammaproteobacteria bacterium]
MTTITFYEKVGCAGNRQQKALLQSWGFELETRDLLQEVWSEDRLRLFFGDTPCASWFNLSAPKVKDGTVDPQQIGAEEALRRMVAEPLLIRRPLLELGEVRQAGFDNGPVLAAVGIELKFSDRPDSCPKGADEAECQSVS